MIVKKKGRTREGKRERKSKKKDENISERKYTRA